MSTKRVQPSDYRLTPVKNGVIVSPAPSQTGQRSDENETMVFTDVDKLREFLNDEYCGSFNYE